MVNNTIYFLRHAETKKDPSNPPSQWELSEIGRKKSEDIAKKSEFSDVDLIISADEKKSYQTAEPLAKKLGKEVIRIKELNEINRDKGGFLDIQEYSRTKRMMFMDPDFSAHGWETARSALERFSRAVEEIDRKYDNKKILIVASGTVITLYFALLQDDFRSLIVRWKKLDFCEWGAVENGRVLKDVI